MARLLHRAFLFFCAVVAASFVYGAYLIQNQQPVTSGGARAAAQDADPGRLLGLARSHLEADRTEQALMAYRQLLTQDPASITAQLGIAEAELRAGREAVAAREYERALALDSLDTVALRQLGLIYSRDRQTWARAEQRLRQYLHLEPGDVESRLLLARVLAWTDQARSAVELYDEPAVAQQMTPADRRDYAVALVKTGRPRDAEVVILRLLAEQAGDFELRLQLAAIYAARQDWAAALPQYEALLRERPNDAQLNLTYGLGLLAVRRHREALGPLGRARQAMPGHGEAGLAYARALQGAGNLRAALTEFERVLPQYGGSAAVQREYADLRLENRDYRQAEESYKRAHALGLRDTRLLVGLAGALSGSNKHQEAVPYLREAYTRQPTDRLAYELASALHQVGRHQEALELLNRIDNVAARRE